MSRHERWIYGGAEVQVVNSYKYLGLKLATKFSTTQAEPALYEKSKEVLKALRKNKLHRLDSFIQIFDAQIQPALSYASEIWGSGEWKMLTECACLPSRRC